nr:immunoglobulin heavy chain junction region [Mus musculus]
CARITTVVDWYFDVW